LVYSILLHVSAVQIGHHQAEHGNTKESKRDRLLLANSKYVVVVNNHNNYSKEKNNKQHEIN
jgi:hypothetical protein